MNIILGQSQADLLKDKHLVLELDTITMGNSTPITAYCVVENIPLDQIAKIQPLSKLHSNLMENYRKRQWSYCQDAIDELVGSFGGQLDSFYTDLLDRVVANKENEPDESWTGIIAK
jgi:hypothetical protein